MRSIEPSEKMADGFNFAFDDPPQATTLPSKGSALWDLKFPVEDLVDIGDGKKQKVVWGTFVYRDGLIDTPVRVSEFCIKILGIAHLSAGPKDLNGYLDRPIKFKYHSCPAHDCNDEKCPDYKQIIQQMAP